MDHTIHSKIEMGQRLCHKLLEYISISVYLYVCFATFVVFKSATLRSQGIDYAPYGLAVAKALLLPQFILVRHKLRIAAPFRGATLIHFIIYKSALFLLLLVGLSVIEEAILAIIHHRAIGDALVEFRGGKLGQIMALHGAPQGPAANAQFLSPQIVTLNSTPSGEDVKEDCKS